MSLRRIRELEEDNRHLRDALARRPIMIRGGGVNPVRTVIIVGGNALDDGVTLGCRFVSPIAEVPLLYDPNVDATFVPGIGRGFLYIDGALQDGYVLVVNDGRGPISWALFEYDVVLIGGTATIPVSGGGGDSITALIPYMT
ncbi:MAG: hypothetical protein H0W48_00550 [Methylibium sp.]|nr:hypothetical protein [Methylibium sp.]